MPELLDPLSIAGTPAYDDLDSQQQESYIRRYVQEQTLADPELTNYKSEDLVGHIQNKITAKRVQNGLITGPTVRALKATSEAVAAPIEKVADFLGVNKSVSEFTGNTVGQLVAIGAPSVAVGAIAGVATGNPLAGL